MSLIFVNANENDSHFGRGLIYTTHALSSGLLQNSLTGCSPHLSVNLIMHQNGAPLSLIMLNMSINTLNKHLIEI